MKFRYPLSLTILFLVIGVFADISAQSYNTALGLRAGELWGLSLKQRVMNRSTIEGIIQQPLGGGALTTTLLIERHIPLLIRNLNLYGGIGLHKDWMLAGEESFSTQPYGVSLMGGAELTIGRFNISWDLKPAIDLNGQAPNVRSETAISLRYVLWKRGKKNKEKKWQFWKKDPQKKRERERRKKKRQRAKRRR